MDDEEIFRLFQVYKDEIDDLNRRFTELFLRVGALQSLLQQRTPISEDAVDQRIEELRSIGHKEGEKARQQVLEQQQQQRLRDKLDDLPPDAKKN